MSTEENKVNTSSIDLGSDPGDDFDPFASEEDLGAEIEINTSAQEQPATEDNPLESAIDAVETKEAATAQQGLTQKSPVFEYAGASEAIDDTAKTFEELRIEKAKDFPELDDGKRVSWTVEYGKISKNVSDPKSVSIGKMKSDIEASKEFIEALKKSKDKNPACKLKPRVTAQSKGTVSAYKGVFSNLEDAIDSGKLITFFPAKDGKVYEMRQNDIGRFITQSTGSDMLSVVEPGFTPNLPLIPFKYLLDIISFFKKTENEGGNEALVNIYWDKHDNNYIVDIPEQTASPISVDSCANPTYDNDRYIHYMDIHSHCKMRAFFSATDDKDERATRVYAVIGSVHNSVPEIKVRISNGGTYLEIEPDIVFGEYNRINKFGVIWLNQIQKKVDTFTEMFFGMFKRKNGGDA